MPSINRSDATEVHVKNCKNHICLFSMREVNKVRPFDDRLFGAKPFDSFIHSLLQQVKSAPSSYCNTPPVNIKQSIQALRKKTMSHNSNTEEKMDASEAEKAESPAATDTNNDTNNNADPVMASPVKKDGTNTTTVASDEHHQPNEEEEEKKESSAEKKRPLAENDTTVPRKPIKRARTAYFIFAEERRPEVQKQVSDDEGTVNDNRFVDFLFFVSH